MNLFDHLIGSVLAKNREILFEYQFGRDSRPSSLRPGREFYQAMITTRNKNNNDRKISWFYHSDSERKKWFMTSLSLRGMGFPIITEVIGELDNLEYLDLQGNDIGNFQWNYINSKKHNRS